MQRPSRDARTGSTSRCPRPRWRGRPAPSTSTAPAATSSGVHALRSSAVSGQAHLGARWLLPSAVLQASLMPLTPSLPPALQNAALLAVPVAVSAAGMRAACSCTPSATTGSWRCPRAPGATGSTWGTRAASPALRVSVRPSASASAPASAPAAHVGCAGAGGHLPPASCRCRPPRRRCLLLMAPDVCVDPLPCNQPACLLCPPISPVPRRRGCVPRHAGRARGRVRAQLCVQQRRGRV